MVTRNSTILLSIHQHRPKPAAKPASPNKAATCQNLGSVRNLLASFTCIGVHDIFCGDERDKVNMFPLSVPFIVSFSTAMKILLSSL